MSSEDRERSAPALKPFTVSAVYDDGLEALIRHCTTADAQAARDEVIMDTNGRVIIASVFEGHLVEPDSVVFQASESGEGDDQEEADGVCM